MRKTYNSCFDIDNAQMTKGLAILLMVIHHLWTFPDRLALENGLSSGFMIFGQPFHIYMGTFSKICVSVFMFVAGYGICISYLEGRFDMTKRLKTLYISFWKVFLIFIPIGFIFFTRQSEYCTAISLCNRFSDVSGKTLLSNFLGLSFSYNSEWWFFRSYIIAVITFPLIIKIIQNRPLACNMAFIVIGAIAVDRIFPAIGAMEVLNSPAKNSLYSLLFCQTYPYITCFWMGIVMAEGKLLDKLKENLQKNKLLHPLFDIAALFIITFMRNSWPWIHMDFLYVPAMIVFFLDILKHLHLLNKVFFFLGAHSTNIWYIHSFFCYYFEPFAKFVVKTGNAYISLFTLMALAVSASLLVNYFWETVRKLFIFVKSGKETVAQ